MIDALMEIKEIRAHNNDLWMTILDIALRVDPTHVKEILRQIKRNDSMIVAKMNRIIDE
jgi:hypothetical protein